jgi:hypothetical protein
VIFNNHLVLNLFPLIDDEKAGHGIVIDEYLSFVSKFGFLYCHTRTQQCHLLHDLLY